MSYPVGYDANIAPAMAREQTAPIEVTVKNFADNQAKPEYVRSTTLQTYVLDPANLTNVSVAVAGNEPHRVRMEIQVIDQAVVVTTEAPSGPYPVSAAAGPPISGGRYLPVATVPYCFYGPDPMWIVAITANTVTRVGVLKEYR